MRYLHTMLRVRDLDKALDFYCNKLRLKESFRIENRPLQAVSASFHSLGTGCNRHTNSRANSRVQGIAAQMATGAPLSRMKNHEPHRHLRRKQDTTTKLH